MNRRRPAGRGLRRISLCAFLCLLSAGSDDVGASAPTSADAASSLRRLAAADLRVSTIAWHLQTAAADYCSRHENLTGLIVEHRSQYGASTRPVAAAILNLRDWPTVIAVVPRSSGDLAGVRSGDEIVAVNGQPLIANDSSIATGPTDSIHAQIVDRLRSVFDAGPAEFKVRRAGSLIVLRVGVTPACASNVQIDLRDGLNSVADGQTVSIWKDLIDFTQSDDELAFAVAHEIAHNILGHPEAILASRAKSGFMGKMLGDAQFVRQTEEEADYLGLYMVAWAGYDVHAASRYMARYGRRTPGWLMSSDHPTGGARAVALATYAAEIEKKRAAGTSLQPDGLSR